MGQKHKYGVVIDAGSSGSRVYVYQYKRADFVKNDNDQEELERLPKVMTKDDWHVKIHPGISTFGEQPEKVGEEHLKELVDFATDIVPKDDAPDTPIFLLATAGMRLLPDDQRKAVLAQTCTYLQKRSPFSIPDCDVHVQVIPGETEGLYGWIAANYLLGGFDEPIGHDHGKGHHTYGFLDMGGASAQIAFAPNATEAQKHANDLKLLRLRKVNGEQMEYGVFVTTWLGFGANEARRRYVEQLINLFDRQYEIEDPCLPVGLHITPAGKEIEGDLAEYTGSGPILIGTGDFSQCLDNTYPLLEKTQPCYDEPCLLNGVHTPAIDFDVNHFVGVSEYWHTTHEIFAMAHKDKAYDFHTYQKQVTELCEREWASIEADVAKETWGHKVDEQTVEEVCFKASWLINMLHDGIGVPRVGKEPIKQPGVAGHENGTNALLDHAEDRGFLDPFQAVNDIDGTEVSWTLGKMLLYASSQMPPAKGAMAVGFGSNVPGVVLPPDFQHPSGSIKSQAASTTSDESSGDWYDDLTSSSYSRRIPGILIVLLIIALAVYLLCGRERRASLLHKLTGNNSRLSPSKRRKPNLASKLFGSTEPSYERVLEDGPNGTHTPNFELTDVNSDTYSDAGSIHDAPRTGRASGWATGTPTRALSPDLARATSKSKNFDSVSSSSSSGSANAFVNPLERGGLIGRVDSRERLATFVQTGGATVVRSVGGSPRRSPLHGPLSPFVKANVD